MMCKLVDDRIDVVMETPFQQKEVIKKKGRMRMNCDNMKIQQRERERDRERV